MKIICNHVIGQHEMPDVKLREVSAKRNASSRAVIRALEHPEPAAALTLKRMSVKER